MAWCPYCGKYWIVKTGRYINRPVTSRSHNDIIEPMDLPCPTCASRFESRESV